MEAFAASFDSGDFVDHVLASYDFAKHGIAPALHGGGGVVSEASRIRQHKTRQDKSSQKASQEKKRLEKERKYKTRQDKRRQEKARGGIRDTTSTRQDMT